MDVKNQITQTFRIKLASTEWTAWTLLIWTIVWTLYQRRLLMNFANSLNPDQARQTWYKLLDTVCYSWKNLPKRLIYKQITRRQTTMIFPSMQLKKKEIVKYNQIKWDYPLLTDGQTISVFLVLPYYAQCIHFCVRTELKQTKEKANTIHFNNVTFSIYLICPKAPLRTHAAVSSGARGINFGLDLQLHPYFVYANNDCADSRDQYDK